MRLAVGERAYLGWPESELYEAIGSSLVTSLPRGWSRGEIACAVLAEGVVELAAKATMPDGREERAISLHEAGDVDGLMIELRERMDDAGHGLWVSARFAITADKKFDISFSYD